MSRTHPIFLLWALASIAILSPWSAAFANPTYTVTNLGAVPGVISNGVPPNEYPYYPVAINSSGEVVGTWQGTNSIGGSPATGLFLYSNSQMANLAETLPAGLGINNAGTLTQGNEIAINNSGETIGWDGRGFLNDNGSQIDLPVGFRPTAINDQGVVVGAELAGAAIYAGGTLTLFGPGLGQPSAINNAGQIVGAAPDGIYTNAYYFDGSTLHMLGAFGGAVNSVASAINNRGEIVGSASIDAAGDMHAFLSLSGSPMVDLNTLIPPGSGWVLTSATAINDLGVIVGVGSYNGQLAAFELTPVAQPVPEPVTLALACVCVVYVGLQRWSRRRLR